MCNGKSGIRIRAPLLIACDRSCASCALGISASLHVKTPYRDGTTYVIFEPLDFIARLSALVPRPRVNLTRFHGVFAPNSKHRALVTPAKRGKGNKLQSTDEAQDKTPTNRHAAMTWAQRLKRVFNIDVETCRKCGGAVKLTVPALPAPTALVRPCTSSPALKIHWSSRKFWITWMLNLAR